MISKSPDEVAATLHKLFLRASFTASLLGAQIADLLVLGRRADASELIAPAVYQRHLAEAFAIVLRPSRRGAP